MRWLLDLMDFTAGIVFTLGVAGVCARHYKPKTPKRCADENCNLRDERWI